MKIFKDLENLENHIKENENLPDVFELNSIKFKMVSYDTKGKEVIYHGTAEPYKVIIRNSNRYESFEDTKAQFFQISENGQKMAGIIDRNRNEDDLERSEQLVQG